MKNGQGNFLPKERIFLLLLSLAAACGGEKEYQVVLVFPDQQARDLTRQVEVFALEAGGQCSVLTNGEKNPGDAGYRILDQTSGDYPSGMGLRGLRISGGEPALFFARARQANDGVILAGCAEEPSGGGEVEISLQWVCRPISGNDSTCDGVDDDCDEQFDEDACPNDQIFCNGDEYCDPEQKGCLHRGDPCAAGGLFCDEGKDSCVDCLVDDHCDDRIGCTSDYCDVVENTCVNQPQDSLCPDDGLYCNGLEYCDAEKDCQHRGDPCLESGLSCNEEHNTCNICETNIDCVDSHECTEDVCDTQAGTCVHRPREEMCPDDGLFCNGGEYCDSQQGCTHRGNPCAVPGECNEDRDSCGQCGDGKVNDIEDCDPGAPQRDHCCEPTSCRWVVAGSPDPQKYCSGAPECKIDVCDGGGACITVPANDGMNCGSSADTECDNPDTCRDGVCQPNYEVFGIACGDTATTVCSDPDFCDGAGKCLPNHLPAGHEGNGGGCPTCQDCNGNGDCTNVASNTKDVGCNLPCRVCNGSGTCVNVVAGQDPTNDCPTTTCKTGTCDGAGACGNLSGGDEGDESGGAPCPVCLDCDDSGFCTPVQAPQKDVGCDDPNHFCDGLGKCEQI